MLNWHHVRATMQAYVSFEMAMNDSNRINGELLIEIDINNCLNVRHCHEATTGYEATGLESTVTGSDRTTGPRLTSSTIKYH